MSSIDDNYWWIINELCQTAKENSFCLAKQPFTATNLAFYNIGFGIAAVAGGLIIVILRNRVKHSSPIISNKDGNAIKSVYLWFVFSFL